jgi:hypothetical protein
MHSSNNLPYPSQVLGVTLVDITATGVTRGDDKKRNQQRNWETVLQMFGLLTQPIITQEPVCLDAKDPDAKAQGIMSRYGKNIQFQHTMLLATCNIWIFQICSENADVFGPNLSIIKNAFDMIPIITDLDEHVTLNPASFNTSNSELINIQFFDCNYPNK